MSDDKVTIGGALSYAWSLWTQNWRVIWGVLAFYALSSTVLYAGQLAHDPYLTIGGGIAAVIADFATNGAIFRLAFAKEAGDRPDFKLGVLGLQWRGMEWRMLGATLLIVVFFILVGALATVAVLAVIAGVMMARNIPLATTTINPDQLFAALGPTAETAIYATMFVVCAVLFYFAVRLSLAIVASAVSGKVQVLRSAALTRGRFLALFGTRLALWLPAFLLGTLLMGGLNLSNSPAPPPAAFAIALAMGVFGGGVLAPLLAGALAYFYRNLRASA